MADCQRILEGLPFPWPFTADERSVLCADGMGIRAIVPGEVLIREGAHDRDLWLLLAGSFNVVRRVQPNIPLGTLTAGSFCGEIAWFTGQTRTASVIANEPGVALRLQFERMSDYAPDLLLKIYHNLLADVIGRKAVLHDILFRLAMLERELYGGTQPTSPVGFLRGFSFFEGLTAEEAQVLRAMKPGREIIPPGGFVFREGECYDNLFLLLRGSVMISLKRDPSLVLLKLGPDRVLGLDSLFRMDCPHEAHHMALETCEGVRFTLEAFHALDPALKLKLYWRMALTLINRLAPINVARIKLEHMEGKMWFGG